MVCGTGVIICRGRAYRNEASVNSLAVLLLACAYPHSSLQMCTRVSLFYTGDIGEVFPRKRVQEHPVLSHLLPCGGGGAQEVWAAGLEQVLPLQHGRPHHQCQCALQLPGGQQQGGCLHIMQRVIICVLIQFPIVIT